MARNPYQSTFFNAQQRQPYFGGQQLPGMPGMPSMQPQAMPFSAPSRPDESNQIFEQMLKMPRRPDESNQWIDPMQPFGGQHPFGQQMSQLGSPFGPRLDLLGRPIFR